MKKACNKCKQEKLLDKFDRDKNKKDGKTTICKDCRKRYRQDNREKTAQYGIEYRKKNKEILIERKKRYHQKNRERELKRMSQWRKNNKEKTLEYKKRYRNNKQYRIRSRLAVSLKKALKRVERIKNASIIKYIGCKLKTLERHLNSTRCKNWNDNLHIDHIIPCSLFDHTKQKEIKKCWNWKNLRYLPAKENISKGDILDMDLVKQYGIEHLLPENNGEKR